METRGSGADAGWAVLLSGWPRLVAAAPENLVLMARTSSTHTICRRLIEERFDRGAAPRETLVLAHCQVEGRGRLGRRWSSPAGQGVYGSLVVPVADPRRLQHLPLLAGLGLARALDTWLPEPCRLKWPNDLLAGGRKIGGILIESVSRGGLGAAVIGFGVNWSQSEGELPTPTATSLRLEAPTPPTLPELAIGLVAALREELASPEEGDRTARAFAARLVHREGDEITFGGGSGPRRGTFRGIDRQGRVRLEVDGVERRFVAGDLGFEPRAGVAASGRSEARG